MPGAPNPKAHLPLYIELIEIGTEGSGLSLQALPKGVAYIPRSQNNKTIEKHKYFIRK